MNSRRFGLVVVVVLSIVSLASAQLDTALFRGMRARSIGPAGMSGRITAIDAVVSNPDIIYAGVSIGGVWKSTNAGTTWRPIFDQQPVAAVGSVALFQPNPSIVWVGTGEGNPRNSASVGNGVYKSLDGGETWTHSGLDKTERIHRILLHPQNEDVAYAAAMGQEWGENPDRGVFKTTDGGKSWRKILYVNEKVGCAELVMDPNNPNKLFAAMWEYRRWPWFFKSGGPGSGLYVTYDAGETWKRLTEKDGLPAGDLGRIGLAVSKNIPDVVYAMIESKKNALYRSDDGGHSFKMVNNTPNVNERPFYFCDLRIDPQNENRLYSLRTNLQVSNDAGKSFTPISFRVHSDHHALWIHPGDGSFLIDGNDGGVAISRDRGRTWRFVDNLPLGQFYHISMDNEIPFNVYGGMQDNGSWRGPSDVWERGGITNWHWNNVGGGDGFGVLLDASNPSFVYSMSQGGNLTRRNWKMGEGKDIRPWGPDSIELRFNWNAGIAQDPFEPKTIYYGSQFLHKSPDRGDTWTLISPDLTTNDPSKQKQTESGGLTKDVTAAENHCTIVSIAPSPLKQGVLWVGTDDGNVQVTQDGGKTWTNTTGNIPDVPKATWVPHIEASKFDAGTAYVVCDDHRRSNWKTYVFKTSDFGKTWTSATKNDPTAGAKDKSVWGYALTVVQDPSKKDLLYLGTEFGLWVSTDDGKNWMKWTHGLPTASVMALAVHPRDNDLAVATHGRAAFILDDVRPLRSVTKEILDKPLYLFEIPTTYQHFVRATDGYNAPGDATYRGEARPYGALLTYSMNPPKEILWESIPLGKDTSTSTDQQPEERGPGPQPDSLKKFHPDSIKVNIEVLDDSGKVIRKFDDTAERGVNRVAWNLRTDGVRFPRLEGGSIRGGGFFGAGEEERAPQGPEVIPGKYTVRIKLGKYSASQMVEVLPDPRASLSIESRKAKWELIKRVHQRIEVVNEAVDRIVKTRRAIDATLEQAREHRDSLSRDLRRTASNLKKKLTTVADLFIEEPNREQGITRSSNTVAAKLGSVLGTLSSSWDTPNETERIYLRQAEERFDAALKQFNKVFAEDVVPYKQKVDAAKLSGYPATDSLDANWKPKEKR